MLTARYTSGCSECPNPIEPGNWIQADGSGRWIHARHHGWKPLFGLVLLTVLFCSVVSVWAAVS